ncbi:hypothetical protein [Tuwongella immobilis]|uniref:Uncharacterized protein n=1 Tax=Tuwongella immobilis TaxID=692036 RepID=A0A6C2YSJ3_9BACT|nr:hypothetical protein [Tuwongella immobilis]VIP03935.1 unnamed protein product [Tuwongella immobilis]VTS05237.1 unnamed protein product [Tuwongella immobilis]
MLGWNRLIFGLLLIFAIPLICKADDFDAIRDALKNGNALSKIKAIQQLGDKGPAAVQFAPTLYGMMRAKGIGSAASDALSKILPDLHPFYQEVVSNRVPGKDSLETRRNCAAKLVKQPQDVSLYSEDLMLEFARIATTETRSLAPSGEERLLVMLELITALMDEHFALVINPDLLFRIAQPSADKAKTIFPLDCRRHAIICLAQLARSPKTTAAKRSRAFTLLKSLRDEFSKLEKQTAIEDVTKRRKQTLTPVARIPSATKEPMKESPLEMTEDEIAKALRVDAPEVEFEAAASKVRDLGEKGGLKYHRELYATWLANVPPNNSPADVTLQKVLPRIHFVLRLAACDRYTPEESIKASQRLGDLPNPEIHVPVVAKCLSQYATNPKWIKSHQEHSRLLLQHLRLNLELLPKSKWVTETLKIYSGPLYSLPVQTEAQSILNELKSE